MNTFHRNMFLWISVVPRAPITGDAVVVSVCTSTEFRCDSDRCLPLSQQCDRTPQCLDQSDEGKRCGLLTVVCLEPSRCFILSYSYYEVKLTCSNFIWANQPIKIECQVRTAVGSRVSHKGDPGSISALCASDSIFNSILVLSRRQVYFSWLC